ncbi:NAD(P)-dependent alcohol dehydrogenase [Pedobacter gandavensis]|uniref:NAD(P)-dependent alcohol dehydrogenase n=1 Tax=Pedobacter gandavensis TaxID=2679963 RepID=UPI00292EDDFD|nr:NAD(P)-dependent alcohol dehydrogenase [Pedobacter gandavensis]
MKIKAAVLPATQQPFLLTEINLDTELRADEVLVKIVATGLCHTDLSIRDEQIPFEIPAILGHEGAGIVERIGSSVTKVKEGDHVVLVPASCGKCSYCKSGHPSYCSNFFLLNLGGTRGDGSCPYHDHEGKNVAGFFFGQSSFATYSLASENNLVKVPTDVPLEILGPLGCSLQTGSGTVLNVLRPQAGEGIVVSGVGPVGLAAIMAAKAAGCTTIIAVDVHENRLTLAKELGATHTINSRNTVISDEIVNNIYPGGVHYGIDTTGRNDVINQMVGSLRYMGKAAIVAIAPTPKLEIDYAVFMTGKSLQYVLEGDSVPDIFIPQLIELYKRGLFPFDKLIKFYNLEDINQAVEDSENGTTLKAVLRMPH